MPELLKQASLLFDLREKERLRTFLAKPRSQRLPREVAWVYELLRSYRSIEYARDAAREFADGARRELDAAYAEARPGADLDFLKALLEFMVSRDV